MKRIIRFFLVLQMMGFAFQDYSQDSLNEILPKLVSQSYLDSTRSLTKGEKGLNATYLQLAYNFGHVDSVEWIYNEVRVPVGEAPIKTYFCAISGAGYYCGIQANQKDERRVIFSVWDNKLGNDNKEKTAESERPNVIAVDEKVVATRFGNEGSGLHTHLRYNWKEDSIYKFLIHSVPDAISKTTVVTLFVEMNGHWKMIAKIKRPEFLGYEKGASSFLEDISKKDDEHRRSASFQNLWVRKVSGEWVEITKANYLLGYPDGGRKIKDYGCGISPSNGFILSSGGGFTNTYLPVPIWVLRKATNIVPVLNLPE